MSDLPLPLAFANQIDHLVEPVRTGLTEAEAFAALLADLGWQFDPAQVDLERVQQAFGLREALDALQTLYDQLFEGLDFRLAAAIWDSYTAVRTTIENLVNVQPDQLLPAPFNRAAFWQAIGRDLPPYLVARYVREHQPFLYGPLLLTGVFTTESVTAEADADRRDYMRYAFDLNGLSNFTDPKKFLRLRYGWGSTEPDQPFQHQRLLADLETILRAMGFAAALVEPAQERLDLYYEQTNPARTTIRELRLDLFDTSVPGSPAADDFRLRISLLPIPPDNGQSQAPVGLAIIPEASGPIPAELRRINGLKLEDDLAPGKTIRVEVRPGSTKLAGANLTGDGALSYGYIDTEPLVNVGDGSSGGAFVTQGFMVHLAFSGSATKPDLRFGFSVGPIRAQLDLGALLGLPAASGLRFELARLDFYLGETETISLQGFTLASTVLPIPPLSGDLTLNLKDGSLQTSPSQAAGVLGAPVVPLALSQVALAPLTQLPVGQLTNFVLREPEPVAIDLSSFGLSGDCIRMGWSQNGLNGLLAPLKAGLRDAMPPANIAVALQIVFGKPLREVRFDLTLTEDRKLQTPGFTLTIPGQTQLTLALQSTESGALNRIALLATLQKDAALSASTTFAWNRDEGRELHNQESTPTNAQDPPLLEVGLKRTGGSVTVLLFDLTLGGGQFRLPRLFRQLTTPLPQLNGAQSAGAGCTALALGADQLQRLGEGEDQGWEAELVVNLKQFQLPFLKNDADNQVITVEVPAKDSNNGTSGGASSDEKFRMAIALPDGTVSLPIGLQVKIDTLELSSRFEVSFNFERLAFAINHAAGIPLYADVTPLPPNPPSLFGFTWRFEGKEISVNKYHYLTLVTADANYSLQQAPDSKIILEYSGVSDPPLRFAVTEFVVGAKGISLRAKVDEAPVRLKGLGTEFSFKDTELRIVENRVQDLTLTGTGSLPPDLVGDATASIKLQFASRNGNLALREGDAELTLKKPLESKATRFRFSISKLGLKFVEEGQFHLYFTLTGNAQFVLAPGDNAEGALGWLPNISIDLIEAPLAADLSVLARHVDFVITLPKPKSFSFLGCFEMELRSIGFIPSASVFNGDAAMHLGGQIRFAEGDGDSASNKRDYHIIYIGLPEPGKFFPRLYCKQLAASLSVAGAFTIEASVDFIDEDGKEGFTGEGKLVLSGLPSLEAAFGFLRIKRSPTSGWVRAWFISLNVGRLSLLIPVVQFYIREIGFGFGYRYTIAAISAADEQTDVRALIRALDEISRRQGNIATRDAWALDAAPGRGDPRWTVVLRAMIAQSSASIGFFYNDKAEKEIKNVYLFDVLLAFRSDLTFFMNGRGWINTNYNDYSTNYKGASSRPLVSGYLLLSPRQKRFLARLVSNPNGSFGTRPALPEFVEQALRGVRFSATLLVEPGLVHYELGWPDKLVWGARLGPLLAEFRGGFIFRAVYRKGERELVIGNGFKVTAQLDFRANVDLGFIGVKITVYVFVTYGARYIGVVSLSDPLGQSMFYGTIFFEAKIRLEVKFWVDLFLFSISNTLRLEVAVTAALEVGINGVAIDGVGLRGTAALALRVMSWDVGFDIDLGFGKDNVQKALEGTNKYLEMGFDSDDSTPANLPSPADDVLGAAAPFVAAVERAATPDAIFILGASAVAPEPLETPHYTAFVVTTDDDPQGEGFVVIFPQGEPELIGDTLIAQRGFLPVPPVGAGDDFLLTVPPSAAPEGYTLTQLFGAEERPLERNTAGELTLRWTANWDAAVLSSRTKQTGNRLQSDAEEAQLSLRELLELAFIGEDGAPLSDPSFFSETQEDLSDPRIANPTERDFEAAVRGAFEQFRASPFFKVDPTQEYGRALAAAFDEKTTIYDASGQVGDAAAQVDANARKRAQQIRGLIIEGIVSDLRDFAADPANFPAERQAQSVAFQMGLVFRFAGPRPVWMQRRVEPDAAPQLRQRLGPTAEIAAAAGQVRVFNAPRTSFRSYPPIFNQVHAYASSTTIGIAWELRWDHLETGECSRYQAEPERHLAYYEVRRRALDSNERDHVFRSKAAEVLHRERSGDQPSTLKRLRPHFQVVDQFTQETPEERAVLPAEGRRYLYTITPYDYANNAGRPLSTVVTRYPDDPPQTPADARLRVVYGVTEAPGVSSPQNPVLQEPELVSVDWSDLPPPTRGPVVAVRRYRLIFRRSSTLPVGSYGLDGLTEGQRLRPLPDSSARPKPTDAILDLDPATRAADGSFTIALAELRAAGIFPPLTQGASRWRPEAWSVFVQAIGINDVPSSLAPVAVQLAFIARDAQGRLRLTAAAELRQEERQVADLEWLPRPLDFALLPPEDLRAVTGNAHVPMSAPRAGEALGIALTAEVLSELNRARVPDALSTAMNEHFDTLPERVAITVHAWDRRWTLTIAGAPLSYELEALDAELVVTPRTTRFDFTGDLEGVGFARHPADLRAVRLRWNQGPGNEPEYPLDLHAGYRLFELDIDAHTDATFTDPDLLNQAVRPLQEVRLLPGADLLLEPGDTLGTSQWEAWYPSTILRMRSPALQPRGSVTRLGAWYSWRESILIWPEWDRFTALRNASRDAKLLNAELVGLHPFLQRLLGDLEERGIVDWQSAPPLLPGNLEALLNKTGPGTDPYGWGILHQFGLSTTFALRDERTRTPLDGAALIQAVQQQFTAYAGDANFEALRPHLTVELLFQPGRSVELEQGGVPTDALLGIIQVSLRPTIGQVSRYFMIHIEAPADAQVELSFTKQLSLINLNEQLAGPRDLKPGTPLALRVPLEGRVDLVVRVAGAEELELSNGTILAPGEEGSRILREEELNVLAIPVTDDRTTGFNAPNDALIAAISATAMSEVKTQWSRLDMYLRSLNMAAPNSLQLPHSRDPVAETLPRILAWTQRFFAASAPLSTTNNLSATAPGPWLATAYTRTGTPAYCAPDNAGRLSFNQVIEDGWAHAYRYYVLPYGRYDRLWQSISGLLADEPLLGATAARPDPQAGGLDVVLDRVAPLSAPIVLANRRLDEPALPGRTPAPGRTWEVLVAEHPEQTLIERNQTLVRQLAFRQIAFTMLRRFAYDDWLSYLAAHTGIMDDDVALALDPAAVALVEHVYPQLPDSLPARPDQIELDQITQIAASGGQLTPAQQADLRSLDLPLRVPDFSQGVLALQFDGLPYYYAHRVLLVAQAAGVVSPLNEVEQRNFEYQSPDPEADYAAVQASAAGLNLPNADELTLRGRMMRIPLRNFWESLPPEAQATWPAERPDGAAHTLAALPDHEVVYQIVDVDQGNIEVQVELFFDAELLNPEDPPSMDTLVRFSRRQLGERILATEPSFHLPAATGERYALRVLLVQPTEDTLTTSITADAIPEPTRSKLEVIALSESGTIIRCFGIFTAADRAILLPLVADNTVDQATIERRYNAWFSQTALSAPLDLSTLPPELQALLDQPLPRELALAWNGSLSSEQRTQLLALPGDPEFRAALARLADAPATGTPIVAFETAPLGIEQTPADLPETMQIERGDADTLRFTNLPANAPDALRAAALHVTRSAERYTAVTWQGLLYTSQVPDLRAALAVWARIAAFRSAANAIVTALETRSISHALPSGRPTQDNLPADLTALFTIQPTGLSWSGAAPDDALVAQLLALPGDPAFVTARDALLAQIAGQTTQQPLAEGQSEPTLAALSPALQARLTVTQLPGAFTLAWSHNLPPNDAERAQIDSFVAGAPQDDPLAGALAALATAFATAPATPFSVVMAPAPRRPTNAELAAGPLAANLRITPTSLDWQGLPADAAAYAELMRLETAFDDPDFRSALAAVRADLEGATFSEPLDLELRPQPDALGPLGEQLLLGRSTLRYHGLMTRDEGRALLELATRTVDQAALRRLYAAAAANGLDGRSIFIRARRGSAAPSALQPITLEEIAL